MLDHLEIKVSNLTASYQFYAQLLETIGYQCLKQRNNNKDEVVAYGFGMEGRVYFWIGSAPEQTLISPVHVAFVAKSQEQVQQFYKTGLKLGASDNGEPGYRVKYSGNYYAAFLLDLDGNNIEAVLRE